MRQIFGGAGLRKVVDDVIKRLVRVISIKRGAIRNSLKKKNTKCIKSILLACHVEFASEMENFDH